MGKNKNKYEKKHKRRSVKEIMQHPGKEAARSGKALLLDVVVGVVGGGAAGAIIGRPSLLVGLGVNFAGHFFEMPLVSSFGMGMMAANGFQGDGVQLSGNESATERAKQRLKNYKKSFSHKLYLDKFKKKDQTTDANQQVGEVKYFIYPGNGGTNVRGMDMTALDNIENQIMQSAMQFQKRSPEAMPREEVSGTAEEQAMRDPLY